MVPVVLGRCDHGWLWDGWLVTSLFCFEVGWGAWLMSSRQD